MSRTAVLAWVGWVLMLAGGCAPAPEKRDLDFQVHKLEQERDALRAQLQGAQAKGVAWQKRAESTAAELDTTRAQVGTLSERVDRLNQLSKDLQATLDGLKNRELKRPEIPASPLPAGVDEALQALAGKLGERMGYDRGRGAVTFANDRLFDAGSDAVRSDAHAGLHELAGVLARPELAEYEVIVVGHTDSTPISKPETLAQHATNWHLSVHRAIAVKDVLVKAGLPATRLGVMGYADNRPVGDNPAQNRRVEIFVVRKGGPQPFEPIVPPGKKR